MHDFDPQKVAKLKSAIKEGRLDQVEIERELITFINDETQKGDNANIELLDRCEDMLYFLHTGKELKLHASKRKLHRAIDKYTAYSNKSHMRITYITKYTFRIMAAFIIIVITICGLDFALNKKWIIGESSKDEQQYIIRSNEIDPQIISQCIAEHTEYTSYDLTDKGEVEKILGFTPAIPDQLSNKWIAYRYRVFFYPEWINLRIQYQNDLEDSALLVNVLYFTSYDNAQFAFEQSEGGEVLSIGKNKSYLSDNLGKSMVCVFDGNSLIYLSGEIPTKQLIELANEMIGGN